MPAYNAQDYIQESIDSVIYQSYSNWELIIINDGSTDNTKALVEKNLQDKRIKLFNQKNQGVSLARNYGIKKANGEFIAFLDSDDIWLPNKLSAQINFFRKKEVYFLYSKSYCFKSNFDFIYKCHNKEDVKVDSKYLELLTHDYINTSTVIVKKDVFLELGLFNPDFFGTEDWDMWIRISKIYQPFEVPKYLTLYRLNPDGISKSILNHAENEMKVIKKHVINNNDIPRELKKCTLALHYSKKIMYLILHKNFFIFKDILKILSMGKFSFLIIFILKKIIKKRLKRKTFKFHQLKASK